MAVLTSIALADVFEVRMEGVHTPTAKRWNMVRHLCCIGAPTREDAYDYDLLYEIAEKFYVDWTTAANPYLSDDWQTNLCRVKRIKPTISVFAIYADLTAGVVAQPVDEPDDAMVVRLYTNLGGRMHQGRIYQGGMPDTVVGNGVVTLGDAQDYIDSVAVFFTTTIVLPTNGGSYSHCVWSPTRFAAGGTLVQSSPVIHRVYCDRILRRMGSRELAGEEILGITQ